MGPGRCVLVMMVVVSCGSSGPGPGSGGVSDAELKAACDHGVSLCKSDPMYGQTFGAQDCSNIAASYMGCDSVCRTKAKPIIDCQRTAAACGAFVACASGK